MKTFAKPREASTIVEVAKNTGVSISTVSRALSKPYLVAPATLACVLEAVAELNYQPNQLARGLRQKRSGVIGLAAPDISSPFQSKIAKGLQEVAAARGYQLFLCSTDEDSLKEEALLRSLKAYQLQGLVIIPTARTHENLRHLSGLPVVEVDRTTGQHMISVLIDNEGGAREAVQHLVDLGHTRIATVTGRLSTTTGRERLRGYQQALIEAELPAEPEWIVEGDHFEETGYRATSRLLSLPDALSFTALFTANGDVTAGALQAVQERGLSIPHDLSLVGFDDSRWARLVTPPLTVVEQPAFEMGYMAGEQLFRLLGGTEPKPLEHRLRPRLILRKSTAPPDRHEVP
jgi:LacI family transcriptional regulator